MRSKRTFDRIGNLQLRRSLEGAGWRYTRQRAAVYNYLRSVTCHPTAEQVFSHVREQIPNISLATVYKALEALVDADLATKLAHADGAARYDCRCDPHYHLHCTKSGKVCDVPAAFDKNLLEKLDPKLIERLRQQGFHVLSHKLELIGYFEEK